MQPIDASGAHDLETHSFDRRDDLGEAQAFQILRIEIRRGEEEGEALVEIHRRVRNLGSRARP
jgi:hypothetical protein